MKNLTVFLVDINSSMVGAWQREFLSFPHVKFVHGSIFDTKVDAIVSPANSFGIFEMNFSILQKISNEKLVRNANNG